MKIYYYLGLDSKGHKEQEVIDITDYDADEMISFHIKQGNKIDESLSKQKQVQKIVDELFKEQYNADRREFYHTRRFRDYEDDEGNTINEIDLIADDSLSPLDLVILEDEEKEKNTLEDSLLNILSPKQRERYLKLKEFSIDELAELEGVSRSSIYDTINQIKEKVKKMKNHPDKNN